MLHSEILCKLSLLAYGKGNLHMSVFDGTEKANMTLKDVLHVPKIQKKVVVFTFHDREGC